MTLLTTRALLAKTDDERLRYSEEFEDPHQLFAAVTRAGLYGIVSKLADQPDRSQGGSKSRGRLA